MNRHAVLLSCCLLAVAPLGAQVPWSAALKQAPAWYAEPEATAIARTVLLYQHASGGWPKNLDFAQAPSAAQQAERSFHEPTIDNGGTTVPLQFLASVASATSDPN